jgi:hypothetical protein
VPALETLVDAARAAESKDPLVSAGDCDWAPGCKVSTCSLCCCVQARLSGGQTSATPDSSLLAFGIVPGDLLTPAASEAVVAVEMKLNNVAKHAVARVAAKAGAGADAGDSSDAGGEAAVGLTPESRNDVQVCHHLSAARTLI